MTQFKKNQMLPHPYVESYSGEKGHQSFHKAWILALSKSVETFIMVSISDIASYTILEGYVKYYG